MLRAIITVCAILAAGQAQASFYDICEFDAEVVQLTQVDLLNGTVDNAESRLAAIVRIIAAKDLGGHTDCSGYVGRLNVVKISADDYSSVQEGAAIKLNFETFNGRTLNGVWETTTWTLIVDADHDFFVAPATIQSGYFDATTSEIVLQVTVGGGCGEHNYTFDIGACLETYPVQCTLTLVHKTNDLCRALLQDEVRISLSSVGLSDSYFNGAFLRIAGANDSSVSLNLPFNR